MDDEPANAGPDYPRVTYDEAVEYLTDKQRRKECEVCGTAAWGIGIDESLTVPGLVIQSTMTFDMQSVIPLVMMECRNCGNLKIFRERFIKSYLNTKKDPNSSESGGNV